MKRWLRQHRYALQVAVRRLLSQPFSSLANVLVIALTLSVPIMGASILQSAEPVAREMPVSPEITLFMNPEADRQTTQETAEKIRGEHADEVSSVRVVAREQALDTLKSHPNWGDALAALPGNPLPDSIVITLNEHTNLAGHADELASQWQQWPNVDLVQHDSAWVQRLEAILQFIRIGLALLAAGVVLVVLATIFNTVRLQALTQREEIAVARLVGATESFVRRPFLYLGALTGLISALAAVGLARLALTPLNAALDRLASTYGTQLQLVLPDPASLALTAIVVSILAAFSARWSVTRNTRF